MWLKILTSGRNCSIVQLKSRTTCCVTSEGGSLLFVFTSLIKQLPGLVPFLFLYLILYIDPEFELSFCFELLIFKSSSFRLRNFHFFFWVSISEIFETSFFEFQLFSGTDSGWYIFLVLLCMLFLKKTTLLFQLLYPSHFYSSCTFELNFRERVYVCMCIHVKL